MKQKPTMKQNSSLTRSIPDDFQGSFFVNARFNMHEGTYTWNQDGSFIISSGPPLPGSFKNEKIMSGNWKNRRKNENIIPILEIFIYKESPALIFNLRFLKISQFGII